MGNQNKNPFRIQISLSNPTQTDKKIFNKEDHRKLKEDVRQTSSAMPPEMLTRIEDKPYATPGTKAGGEIEAILLTITLGKYAIRPIFDFIISLYHEKKWELKVITRLQQLGGKIKETEIVYKGAGDKEEVFSLVEEIVTSSRIPPIESDSSYKELPPPDIEIKVTPASDEEKK